MKVCAGSRVCTVRRRRSRGVARNIVTIIVRNTRAFKHLNQTIWMLLLAESIAMIALASSCLDK